MVNYSELELSKIQSHLGSLDWFELSRLYMFHPPLRLWDLDATSWDRKENPGIRKQVPAQTTQNLIQRTQNKWICMGHCQCSGWTTGTSSRHCETTEADMVWSHYTPWQLMQDSSPGHSRRRPKTRKTTQELDGEYQGLDWTDHTWTPGTDHGQTELEKDVSYCSPQNQIPPTTTHVKGLSEWVSEWIPYTAFSRVEIRTGS